MPCASRIRLPTEQREAFARPRTRYFILFFADGGTSPWRPLPQSDVLSRFPQESGVAPDDVAGVLCHVVRLRVCVGPIRTQHLSFPTTHHASILPPSSKPLVLGKSRPIFLRAEGMPPCREPIAAQPVPLSLPQGVRLLFPAFSDAAQFSSCRPGRSRRHWCQHRSRRHGSNLGEYERRTRLKKHFASRWNPSLGMNPTIL